MSAALPDALAASALRPDVSGRRTPSAKGEACCHLPQ